MLALNGSMLALIMILIFKFMIINPFLFYDFLLNLKSSKFFYLQFFLNENLDNFTIPLILFFNLNIFPRIFINLKIVSEFNF